MNQSGRKTRCRTGASVHRGQDLPKSTTRLLRTEELYLNTEFYGVHSEYYQEILDHTACALSRVYGSEQVRILDILPGGGDFLVGLGHRLDHLPLTAFELSTEFRDHILLKLRRFDMEDRVNFLPIDKTSNKWRIPSINESFDCVTCFNRLNLITDPSALLLEIRRVLPTDGLLILTNVNRLSVGWMYMAHNWLMPRRLLSRTRFTAGAIRAISPRTMRSMLSRNGLKMIHFSGLGGPRALYYRLLAQTFSQFGDMDRTLRYEYRRISSFWEPSAFWSYFANVNFIIATKVK
jgi:ubiquinone/menaquinone biosynthesis C-methylase UbiE